MNDVKIPKVSIIIPVYNAGSYLSQCIDSILSQTYTSFEIILVDDCSTDASVEVCQEWINKDSRIKLYRMPVNSGPAKVRNVGMNLAKGDYYSFIDADDRIVPNYLECLLQNAEQYKADVVWCDFKEVYYKNGTQQFLSRKKNLQCHTILSQKELLQCFYNNKIGLGSMWTKLYRSSFIEQNSLRLDEDRVRAEDWEFNLRTFICNPKVVCIADELYYYERRNSTSVIATYREKDFRYMCINNKRLGELANEYHIEYDKESFYGGFLYNYILQLQSCAHAKIKDKEQKLDDMLRDTYVHEIINKGDYNTSAMTIRQKVIFYLIKFRCFTFTKCFLR